MMYWCLYSSQRSPQYVALAQSKVVNEKVEQPSCMTSSGSMPFAISCATVLVTVPETSTVPPMAPVFMLVSYRAHSGGRAKVLALDGSWPAGVRSVATAALNWAWLVTGLLLMSLPHSAVVCEGVDDVLRGIVTLDGATFTSPYATNMGSVLLEALVDEEHFWSVFLLNDAELPLVS